MNQCNITQNRVTRNCGGYVTQHITSDSYITCVNVIENNQSSGYLTFHGGIDDFTEYENFNVNFSNYIGNKSPDGGFLISAYACNTIMSYCRISGNENLDSFSTDFAGITFKNSNTDNDRGNAYFENTDIDFDNECPYLNLDILNTLKHDCPNFSPIQNDDKEFEKKMHFILGVISIFPSSS